MHRSQAEFQRLYLVSATAGLIDAEGHVRAMVLELARPADWALLAPLWRGVQADLGLPAPAIAASGTEGLQLWFSLAEPVAATEAHRFLDGLRARYLADVPLARLRLLPELNAGAPVHAAPVPALQANGNWSAFVAPDLAPLFDETPWLDIPPGDDGQGQLLAGLASIPWPLFDATMLQLWPVPVAEAVQDTPPREPWHGPAHPAVPGGHRDASSFLMAVVNDEHAPLALRIEAAKALLPFAAATGTRA